MIAQTTPDRIREGGFVYVDMKATLKPLADGLHGTQFVIPRQRRFGKSLAISTLNCLFEGRRELFKGLAIESDWANISSSPSLAEQALAAQTHPCGPIRQL